MMLYFAAQKLLIYGVPLLNCLSKCSYFFVPVTRHLFNDMWDSNMHKKRLSTLLKIRRIFSKVLWYVTTHIAELISNLRKKEVCREIEYYSLLVGRHIENSIGNPKKNYKMKYPCTMTIPHLCMYPKWSKQDFLRHKCILLSHSKTINNVKNTEITKLVVSDH